MFDYQLGDLLLAPFPCNVDAENLLFEPPDGCFGSAAALFNHLSLTGAIKRIADDSTLNFRVPGLERLLLPVGDIQIAAIRTKRNTGYGQMQPLSVIRERPCYADSRLETYQLR